MDQKKTTDERPYIRGLTVFLYSQRTFLGILEGSDEGDVIMRKGIQVKDAVELRTQVSGDPRMPVIQVLPSAVIPANNPVDIWLPPCAWFPVASHKDFVEIYSAMVHRSPILLPGGVARP